MMRLVPRLGLIIERIELAHGELGVFLLNIQVHEFDFDLVALDLRPGSGIQNHLGEVCLVFIKLITAAQGHLVLALRIARYQIDQKIALVNINISAAGFVFGRFNGVLNRHGSDGIAPFIDR